MTDPTPERLYYRNEVLDSSASGQSDWPGECVECERDEANLIGSLSGDGIGSLSGDGMHRPVIDIDLPARLVPSSTEGHFHLYLDVPMTLELYLSMLDAMAAAGVVDPSYVAHVRERGMSMCRPEWVKKPARGDENSEAVP